MKTILFRYYDEGDIRGHYVYELFETIQEAMDFGMEKDIKRYEIYRRIYNIQ